MLSPEALIPKFQTLVFMKFMGLMETRVFIHFIHSLTQTSHLSALLVQDELRAQ